jgi:nucleoside-diphosphate-sugar epimerase
VKVVFASTRQIYGKPDYLPVDEKHLLRPVDVNGINKMAGEWYHILYNNVYGIRAAALRLTNTYGPCMRVKDARQTFLGIWIRQLVEGKPFEVWGGGQLRDFNFVEDVVDAFLAAAVSESINGKALNLGSAEVISLKSLADKLIAVNGGGTYSVRDFPPESKRIDIGDYYTDCTQIHNLLGWSPKVSLDEGLSQTLAYYRSHIKEYL